MLTAAKPKLVKDIKDILYDAAYEAYMSSFDESSNIDGGLKDSIKSDMEDSAKKYAEAFASTACSPMADAIYNFVKEISIMATPTALISPTGPVTGIMNITDFNIL